MGVGNLKKTDKPLPHAATSAEADAFIAGARVDGQNRDMGDKAFLNKKVKKVKRWKSTMFSLDDELNQEIDRLSLLPRTVKRSRSDVIRVAVRLLAEQGDEGAKALLELMDDNS